MKINIIISIIIGFFLLTISCTRDNNDDFQHFFFRNGDADLSVEINGNTASNVFLLYLHGGPGAGSAAYNRGDFSDEMEKDYAVVYLDQRGNGASQGNYNKEELSVTNISDDIFQLTRFLKAQYGDNISIFLAGHSWGGYTSAHALINTPIQENIKGWIEIDGINDFDQNEIEAIKLFQQVAPEEIAKQNNVEFWQDLLDTVNEMDTLNLTNSDGGYLNGRGFDAEAKIDAIKERDPSLPPYFFVISPTFSLATQAANIFGNPILNKDSEANPLTQRLHEIEIPCLFLWGKYDFVVPPAMGKYAFDLVNTTEKKLVIFENSGHSPMANEAQLFTQEVKEFIELYK